MNTHEPARSLVTEHLAILYYYVRYKASRSPIKQQQIESFVKGLASVLILVKPDHNLAFRIEIFQWCDIGWYQKESNHIHKLLLLRYQHIRRSIPCYIFFEFNKEFGFCLNYFGNYFSINLGRECVNLNH